MIPDFLQADRLEGYPPFVCRTPEAGVNWWAPMYAGDADTDYAAGAGYFRVALEVVNMLRQPDFYRHMMAPGLAQMHPAAVLANIVGAMFVTGPMERGFIDALAAKAVSGRLPPISDECFMDQDHAGETFAHNVIFCARMTAWPECVAAEIVNAIDQNFTSGTSAAFIWAICGAAAAGALN